MAQKGYILISDITGYTAYLSQSELEHAQDALRDLLNTLLDHSGPPLVVSRLEGDAIICYALEASVLQGQSLMEMVENMYVVFRRARERMRINTTCACNACTNIPNLDLKFFVHYGEFGLQQLGPHTEMVGNDVNLAHRLLKNRITETTGLDAYAVYTEAAVAALGVADLCEKMLRHSEVYEHLGEVKMVVQNMHLVWERERDRQRVFVKPEDTLLAVDFDFEIGPAQLWDYLTRPDYRTLFFEADSHDVTGRSEGRLAPGAVYHCAHGDAISPHTIVDWQPFEEYSWEAPIEMPGISFLYTMRFAPAEGGTRFTALISKARGPLPARMVASTAMKKMGRGIVERGCQALVEAINEDFASGRVPQVPRSEVAPDAVEQAVAASLG